jgi:uncharacterized repeat protein (TIGR03803 family)
MLVAMIAGAFAANLLFAGGAPAGPAVRPVAQRAEPTALYRFRGVIGKSDDGARPGAGLIIDGNGALFGTTTFGGGSGAAGTVFQLVPSAGHYTERILHRFLGADDGEVPIGGLLEVAGAFYGTTTYSSGLSGEFGTVYGLTPQGSGYKETILYAFHGQPDGEEPVAAVITDASGAFYGTTLQGGTYNFGAVFALKPAPSGGYTEHVLHSFDGVPSNDGYFPTGALVEDARGAFYGTTDYGGGTACYNGAGCGIVFQLVPAASGTYTENVIYRFQGGSSDGAFPDGSLIADSSGALYGTTQDGGGGGGTRCGGVAVSGCGTVFKLAPTQSGGYTESILYRFSGGSDGQEPTAALTPGADGALYGTTTHGGAGQCTTPAEVSGCGTAFELKRTPSGQYVERILWRFHGTDGAVLQSTLVADAHGSLYGTALKGGYHCDLPLETGGCGTVFRLSP